MPQPPTDRPPCPDCLSNPRGFMAYSGTSGRYVTCHTCCDCCLDARLEAEAIRSEELADELSDLLSAVRAGVASAEAERYDLSHSFARAS